MRSTIWYSLSRSELSSTKLLRNPVGFCKRILGSSYSTYMAISSRSPCENSLTICPASRTICQCSKHPRVDREREQMLTILSKSMIVWRRWATVIKVTPVSSFRRDDCMIASVLWSRNGNGILDREVYSMRTLTNTRSRCDCDWISVCDAGEVWENYPHLKSAACSRGRALARVR